MRHVILCSLFAAGFIPSLSAQNGQLSLGLSTTYYPTGVAGVGGTLDYRWRLGAHLEAIGQLSGLHFWWVEQQRTGGGNASDAHDPMNLYFGGIGLGYRTGPNVFHIGLLGGGMRYLATLDYGERVEPQIMPGLDLTMGHGIGKRMDLSLDTWILKGTDEKQAIAVLPMLRFSFGLCGGK